MKGLMVRFRLDGLGAEKLLNEVRKKGLPLERIERGSNREIYLHCPARAYPAFCEWAGEKGFSIGVKEPLGLYRLIKKGKARWGTWVGGMICILLLFMAMGRIWAIQIENAGAYEGEVRLFLQEMGIAPGMRKADADLVNLREKLEWRLPRVKWVRLEMRGVTLAVRLEEGMPPPEIESAGWPGDVVAAEDGFLTRLTVFAGTPVAKAGDFVRAGEILIRGEERGANDQWIPVKARGEAMARSWITTQVQLPLNEMLSYPTGREEMRRVLATPFFSVTTQKEPSFLTFDREMESISLGGAWWPIWLQREKFVEVYLEEGARNPEQVKQEGAKAALRILQETQNPNEIVDKWIDFSMIEGDTIVVTATAEISRDIGRYQKN